MDNDLGAETDLTLTIYAAEPDTPSAQALALLASWAATAPDTTTGTELRQHGR